MASKALKKTGAGKNGKAAKGKKNGGRRAAEKESSHPCHECIHCCSYMALEIDAPTTNREYDHMRWYLSRPQVGVFIYWDED